MPVSFLVLALMPAALSLEFWLPTVVELAMEGRLSSPFQGPSSDSLVSVRAVLGRWPGCKPSLSSSKKCPVGGSLAVDGIAEESAAHGAIWARGAEGGSRDIEGMPGLSAATSSWR